LKLGQPDVGHAEILLQQLGRGDHLAQDRARTQQLHAQLAFFFALPASRSRYMPRMMPSSAPAGISGCA
jgi:hypothetical protein